MRSMPGHPSHDDTAMMQIDLKAAVLLFITLVLGVALGALGVGALSRQRAEQVQQLRRAPGFVSHMEDVIQPRDSMQRSKIEPILEATAARNDSILHGTNEQLHAALDTMRARLAPMLDANQRERLDQAATLAPPIRPAGDGEGRSDRGPPPPRGDGGPPPRRGPPPDGRGPPGSGPPRGAPPPGPL